MAHKHPFHEHRQNSVERSRVAKMTKGYASGGAVTCDDDGDEAMPAAKRKRGGAMMAEGKKAKHRRDRMPRAKGGRANKGKGATHVNVIIGGQKDNAPPVPIPVPAGGPPMPPPGLAGMAPHPTIGSPPPGAGAVPMLPRKKGGRVKSGPAYDEGKRNGTQVSHVPAKEPDIKNLGRGKPITFKSGGKVKSFYAKGGAVESSQEVSPASKLPGGVAGGEARLAQSARARSKFSKPMKGRASGGGVQRVVGEEQPEGDRFQNRDNANPDIRGKQMLFDRSIGSMISAGAKGKRGQQQ